MECLLPYLCMVTVPHIMVGLERMSDYRGVGLARFHCTLVCKCGGILSVYLSMYMWWYTIAVYLSVLLKYKIEPMERRFWVIRWGWLSVLVP